MTGGYGLLEYGQGAYGLQGPELLSIVRAYATSTNTLVVVLNMEPMHRTPINPGDALNPGTWFVTRDDTGADLRVLASRQFGTPDTYELYTLYPFADALTTHTVSSPDIRLPGGATVVPTISSDFLGTVPVRAPLTSSQSAIDIANPVLGSGDTQGGTFNVDTSGDYTNDTGKAFLVKLIMRRLTTDPGGFFFISKDRYGLGVRVKEPLPISDVAKLQAQIQNQVIREPEIAEAAVDITVQPDGVMIIRVSAILALNNAQVTVSVPVTLPQVQL